MPDCDLHQKQTFKLLNHVYIHTHTILFLLEALDKKNTPLLNDYSTVTGVYRLRTRSAVMKTRHPGGYACFHVSRLVNTFPSISVQATSLSQYRVWKKYLTWKIHIFLSSNHSVCMYVCGAHLHFPTEIRTKQDASLLSNFYHHLQKTTMCLIQNVVKTFFETSLMSS